MAQRRLFSPDIVSSDAFLDMPPSTQVLYFHLALNADDDGFVTPKKIMRVLGSSDDDIKILAAKRFVLPFESGVVVIKHWLIHNSIRGDRYKETTYVQEKNTLALNEFGAYTEKRDGMLALPHVSGGKVYRPEGLATIRQPSGNQPVPQVKLSKVKLSKVTNTVRPEEEFEVFWKAYPRKIAKPVALKAWVKAMEKTGAASVMKGLAPWLTSRQWTKDGGEFIPHAATWLNQERWNDQPQQAASRVDRFTKQ